jgi:hypothetical protein
MAAIDIAKARTPNNGSAIYINRSVLPFELSGGAILGVL